MAEESKGFIQQIIKAKKNLRLYPSDNPIYVKTVDDVFSKLTSLLEADSSLVFHIMQYDIFSNDEVIYHNDDKCESLALLLFKDGLKKITFKRGIPRDELEEFIRIVSFDFEEVVLDDDIVTLMWEKNFKFIETVVEENFLVDDETYEERAIVQAKERTQGNCGIMKAYEDAFQTEKPEGMRIVPLTNDDLEHIVQEIQNESKDKTQTLLHLLFELLLVPEEKETYKDTAGLINEVLTYAVTQGKMEVIVYALKRIAKARKGCDRSAKMHRTLNSVEEHINSRDFVRRFGIILDKGLKLPEEITRTLSAHLDGSTIPHFIDILGELEIASSRRTVITILSELGKKDLSLILKGLDDDRWYLVRNTIHILRQIRDRSTVKPITSVVDHWDSRVRKEAILALGELGQGDALHILKGCMSDRDESIRIAAVRAVGLMAIPSAKKAILEKITHNGFKDKSFSEKKECFRVLAGWKDRDVIEVLIKILKKRAFFNGAKNDEMKAGAAYCLGLMGAGDANTMLGKLRNSKNKLLRDNVLIAIKKLGHEKVG